MKKGWRYNYPGYWRFALSYFSILILPLFFFILLNERHFLAYYKNDVLRQSALSLYQRQLDLETHLYQMYAVSGQMANLKEGKSYNLERDRIAYIAIQKTLQEINSTHSFFNQIAFYSLATPNTLYTDKGTYNSVYYKQYLARGESIPISSRIENVKLGEWLLPQETTWKQNLIYFDRSLQFVIPVPGNDDSYVIFDIPEENLANLLDLPNIVLLFDSKGNQLFPFSLEADAVWDQVPLAGSVSQQLVDINGNWYYRNSTHSNNYGLYLTQLIGKEYLLQDVISLQRNSRMILIAAALIGGFFVYLVAFYNYQPIRKLNTLAQKTIPGIPRNLSGVAQAVFALNKMDEMRRSLEQERVLEQFIIRLIHGRIRDASEWEEGCEKTGVSPSAPFMYTVMIEMGNLNIEGADIVREVKALMSPEYKLYGIQYPRQDTYLLIVFAFEDKPAELKLHMEKISDYLSGFGREGEAPPQIIVGGVCRDYTQLSGSYMQVVTAFHFKDRLNENSLYIFEELPRSTLSFVYPHTELSSLYESIVNADIEKILLITDILIDIVRNHSYNAFLYNSLCYSIINTYLRAREDLHIDQEKNEHHILPDDYLSSLAGIENLIDMIYALRNETTENISRGAGNNSLKNDISSRVARYIDSHYNDSSLWVNSIAEKFNISISNLSHQFKASMGINISDYIFEKKMNYVKELLATTDISINDISLRIGYARTSSFIRKFKDFMNMTPYEYRLLVKK